MRKSFLIWLFFVIQCLLLLLGCRKNSHQNEFTIAFSQCIGSDAWRETMLKEMRRELSFHPNINFIYRDAKGDNATQIEQIREILKERIDLLIISPNEAVPLTPIVDSVFREKIPVVVTDRKTSSGLYNAYVGADNHAIGALAAEYISNKMNASGNVALITGLNGASASVEREEGFRRVLNYCDCQFGDGRHFRWYCYHRTQKQLGQKQTSSAAKQGNC